MLLRLPCLQSPMPRIFLLISRKRPVHGNNLLKNGSKLPTVFSSFPLILSQERLGKPLIIMNSEFAGDYICWSFPESVSCFRCYQDFSSYLGRHCISEKNQIVDSHPQEKMAMWEVKGLPRRGISEDKKATRCAGM